MEFHKRDYPCGVCDKNGTKLMYDINHFKIVKCNNCSFVYVNPRIADEDLPKLYSSDYFRNKQFGYLDYESTAYLRKMNFERWYKDIKPFLQVEKGNVLDIGCASGYFLEILRNEGWNVQGIELDPSMISVLKEKNIPTYTRPIDTFESETKYDLITLFDVLEHIPDVHDTFKRLSGLLTPNGIIALITPDADSFQHRIFGKHWFQIKPQEHIHYFSANTMQKAVAPYNLTLHARIKVGQYADMNFILNRLKEYKYPFFYKMANLGVRLFGMKKACFYTDTGSIFAIIKYVK